MTTRRFNAPGIWREAAPTTSTDGRRLWTDPWRMLTGDCRTVLSLEARRFRQGCGLMIGRAAQLANCRPDFQDGDRPSLKLIPRPRSERAVRRMRVEGVEHPEEMLIAVERRQRERHSIVVAVEQYQQRVAEHGVATFVHFLDCAARQEHAEAPHEVGVPRVVGHLVPVGRQPRDILDAANAAILKVLPAPQRWLRASKVHELGGELQERPLFGVEVPIDPGQLVVLAVRVVVPVLRTTELVAVADHRYALREQECRQKVPNLTRAQRDDRRIARWSFGAAVPAQVVAFAVAVVLEVGVVVLLVVADQVLQCEPVVRSDEVDARVRTAAAPLIQVIAARDPGCWLGDNAGVAAPEAANRVAVLTVPFGPQHRKIPDLVAALAEIPRFSNQLDLRQHRVLMNDVEERRKTVDVEQLACQRAREVEPE